MRFHPGQQVRAEIERDHAGRDAIRLYITVWDGPNRAYLGEDGNYHDVPFGDYSVVSNPDPGLVIPHGAKAALIETLLEHADAGEVKELRRALELAEARVDRLIDKALA